MDDYEENGGENMPEPDPDGEPPDPCMDGGLPFEDEPLLPEFPDGEGDDHDAVITLSEPVVWTTPGKPIRPVRVKVAPGADGEQRLLRVFNKPENAVIHAEQGVKYFEWTPDWSQIGVTEVVFTATDESGARAFATLTLYVYNYPPSVSLSQPTVSVTPNGAVSVTATAQSFSSGVTYSWSVPNLPPGATFTPNGATGKLTWTPGWSQVKSWPITIQATDQTGLTGSATLTVNVVDYPPSVSFSQPTVSVTPNGAVSVTVRAQSFSPGAVFTWSVPSRPPGATFTTGGTGNATGTFSWTPSWAQVKSWPITFQATDQALMTGQGQLSVNVVDYPPTISFNPPSPVTVMLGNQVTVTAMAQSFSPGATFTWSVPNKPLGATLSPGASTDTLTWTPGAIGTFQITFQATDQALMTGQGQLSVNVIRGMRFRNRRHFDDASEDCESGAPDE